MKKTSKKPKCTPDLAYQVQVVGAPRGWTERYMAQRFGVSTATIRRAKSMPVSRETIARHAAPPKQSPADAAKLVELLSAAPEPEADEPMVEWLAALLDAPAEDGAAVVFCRVPAACLAELAAPEHVRRALACVALVSTDDGEPEHLARARAVLVGASGELATVQAAHFPAEEPEAEEPTQ